MILFWKNWKVIEVADEVTKIYDPYGNYLRDVHRTRLLLQHRFKSHKVKTKYKPIEQIGVWERMVENYVSTIHDDWER